MSEYSDTQDECDYTITIAENTDKSPRNGSITLKYRDFDDVIWETTIYIYQSYFLQYPIWLDTYYIGDSYVGEYSIILDGKEIYKGKARAKPNEEYYKINVARICQDYLSSSLPDIREMDDDTFAATNAVRYFTLLIEGEAKVTYMFLYNWNYCFDPLPLKNPDRNAFPCSIPINGHLDPRMKMLITYFSLAESPKVEYYQGEKKRTKTFKTGLSTWVRDVDDIQGLTLTLKNCSYTVNYCGDYALYYKNRSGGYDSFLIEGNGTKTDQYDRSTYRKTYDVGSIDFGSKHYHNEITTNYKLNTGWLSDNESEILAYNLLSSDEVILHILATNELIPVMITNSEASYKTFKNNSRKLVNYEITLEESQKKILL